MKKLPSLIVEEKEGRKVNWKLLALKWAPRLAMLAICVYFWDAGNWTC